MSQRVLWDPNKEAWVGAGIDEAFIDPFVVGLTRPNAGNTGCRIPYDDLIEFSGTVNTIHPVTGLPIIQGDVISGVLIHGRIDIRVQGVTFEDCWIDGVGLPYGSPGTDYFRLVDTRNFNGNPVTVRHCTVSPVTLSYLNVGFQGGNLIAYRNKILGITDAFSPHGSSTIWKSVEIYGNYAEDFHIDADPNQTNDNITHNDFIQSGGKLSKLWIIGNAVGSSGPPRTSNILLQQNIGTYITDGVRIENNWFRGHPTLGSTVNIPNGTAPVPFTFIDNEVWSGGHTPRILIASALRTAPTSTISGNVDENGNPTTINNA